MPDWPGAAAPKGPRNHKLCLEPGCSLLGLPQGTDQPLTRKGRAQSLHPDV